MRDSLLSGFDIYPNRSKILNKFEGEKSQVLFNPIQTGKIAFSQGSNISLNKMGFTVFLTLYLIKLS